MDIQFQAEKLPSARTATLWGEGRNKGKEGREGGAENEETDIRLQWASHGS